MTSDPNDPFTFDPSVVGLTFSGWSEDVGAPAPPADPARCSKCDRELSSVLDACVYKTDDPTMCRDCR